jgi:glycine cleavage system H protein
MDYRFDAAARYTRTHEWIRVEGGEAVIGVSDYAQHSLSDVVFVEVPGPGTAISRDKPFTVIESVKAAEDVIAPATGTVTAKNGRLEKEPELVNKDPFGEGWLVRVKLADPKELASLMDEPSYRKFVASL